MSVKRRAGTGNWHYRFTYEGHDQFEGGFRLKEHAEDAERIKRNALEAEKVHPERRGLDMTFRAAGEWWLRTYAPSKRSQRVDFSRVPLIVKHFGDQPLRATTSQDIEDFLFKLPELRGEPISIHTRNHYLALIQAIYRRLKKKKIYGGPNPAESVDKIEVERARCRFIYPSEEKILTPAVQLNPDIYAYYFTGIDTGMRIGEMIVARVKHVDFLLGHLFVPKAKNNRSRYVPLTPALDSFLKGRTIGKGPEDSLLPTWSYQYILRHFQAIAGALGMNDLTPHVWRHTFAYNHLAQGASIYKVSILMGHSSIDVTQKHYGHLAAKDLRGAIDAVEPFLSCNRFATEANEITNESGKICSRN